MLQALKLGVVLLGLVAGCAQLPGGTSDGTRLLDAIAEDDVGYIQGAVRSGKLGVNQRIPTPTYPEGAPVIAAAARYGSLKTLRYLIDSGADVNARTPTGETTLMIASYFSGDDGKSSQPSRHEQAVRMLVESGAALENEPHSYTPLSYAAYQGHDRIVRYLLQRGARVNGDIHGGIAYINTPLMMAAMQGHMDTALALLQAGANPRIRVHLGNTAAELAQKNSHHQLAGTLRCAERLAPGEPFSRRCGR